MDQATSDPALFLKCRHCSKVADAREVERKDAKETTEPKKKKKKMVIVARLVNKKRKERGALKKKDRMPSTIEMTVEKTIGSESPKSAATIKKITQSNGTHVGRIRIRFRTRDIKWHR